MLLTEAEDVETQGSRIKPNRKTPSAVYSLQLQFENATGIPYRRGDEINICRFKTEEHTRL